MSLNERKMIDINNVTLDPLRLPEMDEKKIEADVLRLDKIHPVISGNKWFKLKYYLREAVEKNHGTLITFGGAWSNHIIALACAANEMGLSSVGIIRGERPKIFSPTLRAAEQYGMHLQFISREEYKRIYEQEYLYELSKKFPVALVIPEGGSGQAGVKGSSEILSLADTTRYSHILCAIGTGTMYCGIINGSQLKQKIIGIPVLKGISDDITQYRQLIHDPAKIDDCRLITGYHFGGYAKKTPALIEFMNTLYKQTSIPTDFVYTGKLFYALADLLKKSYFPASSKLLIIHSGGLQGNASLGENVLAFPAIVCKWIWVDLWD